jgi:hypothetical protein
MLRRSVTGEGLRGDVSVLGRDLTWNVSRAVHKSVNPSNTSWEMCHVMTCCLQWFRRRYCYSLPFICMK